MIDKNNNRHDVSMCEYCNKKELEFAENLITASHFLEKEAVKDPIDYEEINDLLRRRLSDSYRILSRNRMHELKHLQELKRDRYK